MQHYQKSDKFLLSGWYHSGYPIMGYVAAAPYDVNYATYFREDSYRWGLFHEQGHNQQAGSWSFNGECSCNWWSLYLNEVTVQVA
jgi:hypothetical protein